MSHPNKEHVTHESLHEKKTFISFSRPDSSFMWFLNPFKSMYYILWHNYKWVIIKSLIVSLLTAMIFLFFYSMPGFMAKKIMGV